MIYLPAFLYWLVVFFVGRELVSGSVDNRARLVLLVLMLVALSGFVLYYIGFRPVGLYGDTYRYAWAYDGLTSLSEARSQGADYFGNDEFLFWPFSYLFKIIGFDAREWLALMALISVFLVVYSYREIIKDDVWVVLACVLYLSYYMVFCGAVRQAVAESMVLLAYALSLRNKYIYSSLLVFLAVGFHQSAIVALIFPFFARIVIGWRLLVTLFLGCLLSSTVASGYIANLFDWFGLDSAADKLAMYSMGMDSEFDNLFLHKQFLLLFFVTVAYLVIFSKVGGVIYNYVLYMFLLIFLFWSVPVMSGRMMGYLTLVFPVVVYELVNHFLAPRFVFPVLMFFFLLLGFLVLSTDSTRMVLGFY